MSDTRRSLRISPLLLRADLEARRGAAKGYVTDLSEGGAFVATRQPVSVGEMIVLRMTFPWNLGALEVTATVVRRASPRNGDGGIGLEFAALGEEQRGRICTFLDRVRALNERLPKGVER